MSTPSLLSRFTGNQKLAAGLAVLMAVWLASGVAQRSFNSDENQSSVIEVPLAKVKAAGLKAEAISRNVHIRAKTQPRRRIQVRAQVAGQLASTPAVEGKRIEQDGVLCQLAEEDRQERLAQANASLAKAKMDHDGALRLKTGGYQSRSAIAQANAALEEARANVARRQFELDKLTIRAPFTGLVERRPVEAGALIERGDVCAVLLEMQTMLISGQVSEAEVGNLQVGDAAQVSLSTGQQVTGSVRFIAAESDSRTRGFHVEVQVDNPQWQIKSGLTASVSVASAAQPAYRINPSLLVLDDAGILGVRVVDQTDHVKFVPVTLYTQTKRGLWVQGLDESQRLITLGQHYVSDGQQVSVTEDTNEQVSAAQL